MLKSTLARLRETRVREFDGEAAEEGFTLIELMVVLLIIAILLAIAIPTFLGVSGSANDRAAQSNLTNALTEVKALYQNSQSYNTGSLPVATLNASAPEFTWTQATPFAERGHQRRERVPGGPGDRRRRRGCHPGHVLQDGHLLVRGGPRGRSGGVHGLQQRCG